MRALSLLLLLTIACSTEKKPTATADKTAEPPAENAAPTPAEKTPPAPALNPEVLTLTELQNGDAACYVLAKKASGEEINLHGSFDLCEGGPDDATGLIGKAVQLTIGKASVIAGTCEGDPECTEHEEVDFVYKVQAAP